MCLIFNSCMHAHISSLTKRPIGTPWVRLKCMGSEGNKGTLKAALNEVNSTKCRWQVPPTFWATFTGVIFLTAYDHLPLTWMKMGHFLYYFSPILVAFWLEFSVTFSSGILCNWIATQVLFSTFSDTLQTIQVDWLSRCTLHIPPSLCLLPLPLYP